MAYIQKKYSELDAYIPTLTPGTYDLEVDCTGVGQSDLANFGSKLNTAKADVFFNLKPINIESDVTNASIMFMKCSALTSIDTSSFTNVTNAEGMFAGCSALTSIDTSAFTNVTNADSMFSDCSKLTSIDTSAFTNVTRASWMFGGCSALTSIDTSAFTNVTRADNMFTDCSKLTTIILNSSFANLKDRNTYQGCIKLNTIRCANNPELTKANLIKNKGATLFPDAQITSWQEYKKIEKSPIMTINGDLSVLGNLCGHALNGMWTGRNLIDVLGASSMKDAWKKLQDKSNIGDFSGLGLGDYLDIPSITVPTSPDTEDWGTIENGATETLRAMIVGFDHYYNSQNNFHQIVFQFKNIVTKKAMDSNNTNTGGYPAKQLYTKLNGDFTTGLEAAMGISVKEIKKPFHTAKGSYKYDTPVKCFIPSETEIIGHQNADQDPIWAGSGVSQYALYGVAPQLITRKYNGSFAWWWLSSPYFAGSSYFATVYFGGYVRYIGANLTSGGVSPVFCI